MSEKKKAREENLDEIVFAHRNKEYGAYQLRKNYNKNVIKSLSFAFILLLLVTITPLIMAFNNSNGNNIISDIISANLTKLDIPIDVPPPPPPPPPDPVNKEQEVKYNPPAVVENPKDSVEMADIDHQVDNNNNGEIPDDPIEKKDVIDDADEIVNFYVIEEKPEFPGGIQAMNEWIANNTKYPQVAKEGGISGKVFVQFVIDKDGKVTDVTIVREIDPYLDKEAKRVISEMPAWTPGKQRGKAVKVSFQLPINFRLY